MVKVMFAALGTLHSLSGGGKVVARVKYQQRPEKELLKFPEETAKRSGHSCLMPWVCSVLRWTKQAVFMLSCISYTQFWVSLA